MKTSTKTKTLAGIIAASFAQGCLGPATLAIDPTPTVDSAEVTPEDAGLAEYLRFSATVSDDVSVAAERMNVSVHITPRETSETDESYADIQFPLTLEESYNENKSGLFTTELPADLDIFKGEGLYSAFFSAIDEKGYESPQAEQQFRVCSLPTVEYIAPGGIFPNDASITLEASAAAFCDITSLTLTGENLPETEMIDEDGDGIYTAIVDPTELSLPTVPYTDFSCNLTVTDTIGQEGNADSIFSVEDVVAPVIESVTISPDPADNAPETEVTVTATITDVGSGVDLESVCFQIEEEEKRCSFSADGNDYTLSLPGDSFFSPTTEYTVSVADIAGNQNSFTGTLSVTNVTGLVFSELSLDRYTVSNAEDAPYVVVSVKAGDTTDKENLDVSCLLDGTYVATLTYDGTSEIDGETGETVYGFTNIYDLTNVLVATNYLAAEYSLVCTVVDSEDNSLEKSTTLAITDGSAPTGICTSPTGNNAADTLLSCEFIDENTASSALTVTYAITDITSGDEPLSYVSGNAFKATLATTGIPAGTYSGIAHATDAFDNVSENVSFEVTLEDALKPSFSSFYMLPTTLSNDGSDSFKAYAENVSEETGISFILATVNGADYVMTDNDSDGTYETEEITPTAWPAQAYSAVLMISDGTNIVTDTASINVTDSYAPEITSVSVVDSNGDSDYAVVDDSTESFVVSVCVEDETDGTELDGTGGVQVTLDSLVETLSYNSSTSCYDSRTINGNEFAEGTYTIVAEATDAAANTATDSSKNLTVTCTAATLSNITFSDSEVYNNSNHGDITLSADVAAGTCSASIETVTAELYNSSFNPSSRSDGHTISLPMTDSDSNGTYVSDAMTPYEDLYMGGYSAEVTATNTDGLKTTASGSVPLTVSSICDMYGSGDILEAFVNGTSAASLNTSVDTDELSSFDIIRLGSSGTQFQHARVNYDGQTVEDLDLSSCSGGSFSGGSYVTSSWDNCAMVDSYNGTIASWSVAIINLGGGTVPALGVNSSATTGTGPNWFYNTGTGEYQLDDGVTGSRANFSVGGSYFTLCGNP